MTSHDLLPISRSFKSKIFRQLEDIILHSNHPEIGRSPFVDAANEFAEMTKGTVEIREISKDGKSIGKFAIMPDGTNVTLRNFNASESNANAVIEIVNQDSKNAKETYRFEFKFSDEDKIPIN